MKIVEVKSIICGDFYTFCKVTTDEGLTGWGDGTEWMTPMSVKSTIEDFGKLLVGEDPTNVERIWQLCWRRAYTGGKDLSCALAAITSALIDIVGKIYDIPAVPKRLMLRWGVWSARTIWSVRKGGSSQEAIPSFGSIWQPFLP